MLALLWKLPFLRYRSGIRNYLYRRSPGLFNFSHSRLLPNVITASGPGDLDIGPGRRESRAGRGGRRVVLAVDALQCRRVDARRFVEQWRGIGVVGIGELDPEIRRGRRGQERDDGDVALRRVRQAVVDERQHVGAEGVADQSDAFDRLLVAERRVVEALRSGGGDAAGREGGAAERCAEQGAGDHA